MVKAFKSGNSLAVAIPAELARRAAIKPGDRFEPEITEKGILFRRVESVVRLSPEWEASLKRVVERHREALEKIQ